MTGREKKFVRIGNVFAINGFGLREGGRFFFGNVIVSQEAIYLICGYASLRLIRLPYHWWPDRRKVDASVFTVRLEELGADVTSHSDWPLKLEGDSPFRVRVLLRANGATVLSRWFSGGVTIRCGEDRVWILVSPWRRRELRETLTHYGW